MARLRETLRAGEGPLLMGVLNCTPDSFSDGGQFLDSTRARAHAERLLADGADLVDIGAESTRPRAPSVPADAQIARIGSLVRDLSRAGACISVDTTSAEVARHALDDGAELVNSVDLRPAGELARIASQAGALLCLMHSRGSMSDMQGFSLADERTYGDVVTDVAREWISAREEAVAQGIAPMDVLFDPGLGFHKSARHSLELLARLDELAAIGHHVMVGPSRKSFLTAVAQAPGPTPGPQDRLGATISACLIAVARGARILRVHDVREIKQAITFDRAVTACAASSSRSRGEEAVSRV